MFWILFKTIIIGIIEGITEWLPISSTGHMILANEFIKLNVTDEFWEMFEVVIQLGAIMAVVILFFKDLFPWGFGKSTKTITRSILKPDMPAWYDIYEIPAEITDAEKNKVYDELKLIEKKLVSLV